MNVEFTKKLTTAMPHRWGTALAWWWGLWAPRILQIPLFRNPKGRRLLRVPQFGPQNPAMWVLKSLGTPFRACVRRAFWWYHYLRGFSGFNTGLLELKVTGVFMASVPFTAVSRFRATPVVVGSLAMVLPGDHFLSPVPDGRESYELGLRSTLVYQLELFSA